MLIVLKAKKKKQLKLVKALFIRHFVQMCLYY